MNRAAEWALVVSLIVSATLWARWAQPRVTLSHGAAWDGGVYVRMAEQAAAGRWVLTEMEPYSHRVAVPLIIGRLHRHLFPAHSVVDIYDAVNTAAAMLAAVMLYVWLGSFSASFAHRCVALVLFLITWAGPLRYNVWLPTLVDSFWWVVWCGGLLALQRVQEQRRLAVTTFCVVLGFGALVRESTVWLWFGTLAFLTSIRGVGVAFISGVVAAAALVLSVFVLDGNPISLIYEEAMALARTRDEQDPALLMMLAAAVAFGPILVLPFLAPRGVARELVEHPYQVPIIVVMLVGAGAGLSSQVRHVYWLAPFVYAALVTALDRWQLFARRRYVVIAVFAVLQSIAARVWWPIPDEPPVGAPPRWVWLTPWAGTGHWEDIDVWWATEVMRHIVGLQYLATFAFLAVLLFVGGRRSEKAV